MRSHVLISLILVSQLPMLAMASQYQPKMKCEAAIDSAIADKQLGSSFKKPNPTAEVHKLNSYDVKAALDSRELAYKQIEDRVKAKESGKTARKSGELKNTIKSNTLWVDAAMEAKRYLKGSSDEITAIQHSAAGRAEFENAATALKNEGTIIEDLLYKRHQLEAILWAETKESRKRPSLIIQALEHLDQQLSLKGTPQQVQHAKDLYAKMNSGVLVMENKGKPISFAVFNGNSLSEIVECDSAGYITKVAAGRKYVTKQDATEMQHPEMPTPERCAESDKCKVVLEKYFSRVQAIAPTSGTGSQ